MTLALNRGAVGPLSSPQLETVRAVTRPRAITERRAKFDMVSSIRLGDWSCASEGGPSVTAATRSTGNAALDERAGVRVRKLNCF